MCFPMITCRLSENGHLTAFTSLESAAECQRDWQKWSSNGKNQQTQTPNRITEKPQPPPNPHFWAVRDSISKADFLCFQLDRSPSQCWSGMGEGPGPSIKICHFKVKSSGHRRVPCSALVCVTHLCRSFDLHSTHLLPGPLNRCASVLWH